MSTKSTKSDDVEPEPELELEELDLEELLLEPSPWEAQWPTGAVVRYNVDAPTEELEFSHRTDDGVLLRRRVARGQTLDVSPELALELEARGDFTITKAKGA